MEFEFYVSTMSLTLLLEKCGRYHKPRKNILDTVFRKCLLGIDSQLVSFFYAFAKYTKAGTTCVT
jgi:hypothetical protein